LPNQLDNKDNEENEDFINIADDMLDPSNPGLTYKTDKDSAEMTS
jgi:hypothetical protein